MESDAFPREDDVMKCEVYSREDDVVELRSICMNMTLCRVEK